MAKRVAWDYLKYYSRPIPGIKVNESELTITYPNESKISLYGADNPDSLRGLALWGVVFDEYSQQPGNIFTEIVRPALADHQGYAIWIGTPKGKNEFFRLYETGKQDENWLALLLTVDDTKLLPDEELDDAQKLMTEDEFNQEFYCSFEAAIQGAYYAKEIADARREGRICQVPHEPTLPVYTFWDLGMSDATAILFVQKVGSEVRIIDTYQNTGMGLDHYIQTVLNKPYTYAEHFAPHDIEVRELGTGRSRLEVARNLGLNFSLTPNLGIMDGINVARINFKNYYIDENQTEFIDSLSQYRKEWDDNRGDWKDKPYHDWTSHYADAFRYMAIAIRDKGISNDFSSPKKSAYE